MGFFRALTRMIKGEPVFQPQDTKPSGATSTPTQLPTEQSAPGQLPVAGPKVYPRLVVGETDCDVDGSRMRCYIELENDSDTQLDVDIVRMLGSSLDMGTFLRPGEARSFMVYNGSVPQSTANNRVTVAYRTHPGGDHFTADILLEFKKLPSGGFAVNRARGIAIRDT